MAKEIILDAKVTIAATDLANKVKSVTVNGTADTKPTTGMGDFTETFLVGFKRWTAAVEFYDDFTDNDFNELRFGWWGTVQSILIRKADTAISTANPELQGSVIFTDVPLFGASVGEVAAGSITLQGTGTLVRAVA